jgi:acetyl esterase/lipase
MRRLILPAVLLLAILAGSRAAEGDSPLVVNLWPEKPPGESVKVGEEKDLTKPTEGKVAGRRVIRLGNVSTPTLTVYRPASNKSTGTAVIVCPGGGYHILALDLEGTEVCDWLNSLGVTAVLLKYRVPASKERGGRRISLQDAQRALSLVRSKVKEWGIDPNRIGMLGFSAGGHLTTSAATTFAKRAYEAIDETDKVSCRPDFAVLIYPAYLLNEKKDGLSAELPVSAETPPMFLAHAADDPVPVEGSLQLSLALKRARVPVELHVYASGGHGFGLRRTNNPCTTWPDRCAEWMKQRGLLKKAG